MRFPICSRFVHARMLAMKLWFILFFVVTSAFADTNAVSRGLAWLSSQQRADGSWSTNVALNSLAVLAFHSAGQTLDSQPYGDRLLRGVRHLLSQQTEDGAFTNNGAMMFGQGMATLVLAEVAGMSEEGLKLRPHLEKAVRFILRAQAVEKGDIHAGGWRYFADSKDSDLAVSIWQVAALRAANGAGVRVPAPSAERAARYVARCQRPDGGFAYQPGGQPNQGRTAAGMIALQMCDPTDSAPVERGRQWLQAHPLKWEDEYVYHSAFFLAHCRALDESLLTTHQSADGSWPAPPTGLDEAEAGPLYRTAMAILALTARYHYLPAFAINY